MIYIQVHISCIMQTKKLNITLFSLNIYSKKGTGIIDELNSGILTDKLNFNFERLSVQKEILSI